MKKCYFQPFLAGQVKVKQRKRDNKVERRKRRQWRRFIQFYNLYFCFCILYLCFCVLFIFVFVYLLHLWLFTISVISGGSYIPNWSDLFPPPPAYPPRYDFYYFYHPPRYQRFTKLFHRPTTNLVSSPPSTKLAEVILFPLPATQSPSPTRLGCRGTRPIW